MSLFVPSSFFSDPVSKFVLILEMAVFWMESNIGLLDGFETIGSEKKFIIREVANERSSSSYFTSEYPSGGAWNCDIFRNTLAGNVGYNATLIGAAGNFFDRGCVENLPVSYPYLLSIIISFVFIKHNSHISEKMHSNPTSPHSITEIKRETRYLLHHLQLRCSNRTPSR